MGLLTLCIVASAKFPIDFSRVGYMWGDKPLPEYPVRRILEAPVDGADMTAAIQEALDEVEAPAAFAVGDRVAVCCKVNDEWISDLRMDRIAQNASGSVKQWDAKLYTLRR